MTDLRAMLIISARHLQRPKSTTENEFSAPGAVSRLRSWCSWTTFDRLKSDAGYWTAELPLESELGESYVADGGTWGQPFPYGELAHIIIPRCFIEEHSGVAFRQWAHEQDIDGLSQQLETADVRHYLSEYALEVKLF
jgi:hypothetical protein